MFERSRTVAASALLFASLAGYSVARSQTIKPPASAPELPPGVDMLTVRFAPGRWWHDLRGEVREVETVEYRVEMKNGRAVEARVNSQRVYFDRKGFETEIADGEEGRMNLTYDAQGRLKEMSMSLAGAPLMREVYEYDVGRRRIIAEGYAFGSSKPRWREVSTFDEKWNETRKERETFPDDKAERAEKSVVVYKYTYDAKGRVVASTIGDEAGRISYRFTHQYADTNRVANSTSYSYDEQSGQLLSRYVNAYDERGLVSATLSYDPRGRLVRRETYTREFDQRGNWVTQRMVAWENDRSGTFSFIKRRKITYY